MQVTMTTCRTKFPSGRVFAPHVTERAVVRGIGLRRERQLCVGGDIADIAVAVDETIWSSRHSSHMMQPRLRLATVLQ